MVKAYVAYASRAAGTEHAEPWSYYLKLLCGQRDIDGFYHTEIFILLLAGVGALKAIFGTPSRYEDNRLQRFFTLYAIALVCGYSLLAYKTPWCILTAEHAIVVLAGMGAATLWNIPWGRIGRTVVAVVLSLGFVHLVFQVWEENYGRPADPERNPFVYSHTSPDLLRLVDRVNRAIETKGGPDRFAIMIYHPEGGWPLPWYFRRGQLAGWIAHHAAGRWPLRLAGRCRHFIAGMGSAVGALVAGTHIDLGEPFEWRQGFQATAFFRKELLPEFASKPRARTEKRPPLPLPRRLRPNRQPLRRRGHQQSAARRSANSACTPDSNPATPPAPPQADAPTPAPKSDAPAETDAPPPSNAALPAGPPFAPTPDLWPPNRQNPQPRSPPAPQPEKSRR